MTSKLKIAQPKKLSNFLHIKYSRHRQTYMYSSPDKTILFKQEKNRLLSISHSEEEDRGSQSDAQHGLPPAAQPLSPPTQNSAHTAPQDAKSGCVILWKSKFTHDEWLNVFKELNVPIILYVYSFRNSICAFFFFFRKNVYPGWVRNHIL